MADTRTPPVLWAQRKDKLFVTISVEDCNKPSVELDEGKLFFNGEGGAEKNKYEVTIPFCEAIIPEQSKKFLGARELYFVIKKKEENWWPRLIKQQGKVHWLKTDFSKWRDEDDSDPEDVAEDFNLNEMMTKMGGVGEGPEEARKAALDSYTKKLAVENIEEFESEEDSDDESLPDLED